MLSCEVKIGMLVKVTSILSNSRGKVFTVVMACKDGKFVLRDSKANSHTLHYTSFEQYHPAVGDKFVLSKIMKDTGRCLGDVYEVTTVYWDYGKVYRISYKLVSGSTPRPGWQIGTMDVPELHKYWDFINPEDCDAGGQEVVPTSRSKPVVGMYLKCLENSNCMTRRVGDLLVITSANPYSFEYTNLTNRKVTGLFSNISENFNNKVFEILTADELINLHFNLKQ